MKYLASVGIVVALGYSGMAPAQQASDSQQFYELLDRLGQLEREVRQLRGEQELLQHKLQEAERREQKRYDDLYSRLQSGSGATGQPPPIAPQGNSADPSLPPATGPQPDLVTVPSSGVGGAATAGDPASEKEAYEAAFAKLREGAFEDAIVSFQAFLGQYPQGEYADNSRYWLGEAYYVTRDFPAAQQAFETVISDYPGSNKIPDATLKLGFTLDELNRKSDARRILQTVITEYPDTSVARLAERRLQEM
jgi:tol-pal system protein YbgF